MMARGTVRLSDEFFRSAMQTPAVRAALRAKRDRVAQEVEGQPLMSARGRHVGDIAGLQGSEGIRPAGRPYARLSAPTTTSEGAEAGSLVRQALGEAAARHSAPRGDRRG